MRRAGALVAALMVVLAGCGGARGTSSGAQGQQGSVLASCLASPNTCNSTEPGALRHGGQLSYAIEENISNWNLLSSGGSALETGWVLSAVLPRTFITQPDLATVLNSALLDSATVTNINPETIVYKIKTNAVWSDGTPITADDFIYNWKVQNTKDCPSCAPASTTGYDQVKSVVGTDRGKTVTVTLAKPFTDWKMLWGSGSPLYPAHIAAQHGDINAPQGLAASFAWFGTHVPTYSGGPFQIDTVTNNESITLVPNPRWYGSRPQLDRVLYRIITDARKEPAALRNRDVQVLYPQPQFDEVEQVRKIPGVSSFVGSGMSWEHVDLNLSNNYLFDPALRTALFTAIDRQAIVDQTVGKFVGKIKPLNSHNLLPQQSGYEDVITATGQGSGDVVRARQILTAYGYKIDGGRLITPVGLLVPPLRLRYTVGNQVRQVACELLAQQVKPLGIAVEVLPTDDPVGTFSRGDYDVIMFSWTATAFPYANAMQLWVTGQSRNIGGYSNPDVDRLITVAANSTDETLARETLNQADRRLTRDAYVLPLYQRPTFLALYDNIANIRNNPTLDGPQYDIDQWLLRPAG